MSVSCFSKALAVGLITNIDIGTILAVTKPTLSLQATSCYCIQRSQYCRRHYHSLHVVSKNCELWQALVPS